MKSCLTIMAAFLSVLLMFVPAVAHHSIPAFYNEKASIEITGIVKQLRVINPHSEILVEVTEANGQKATWVGVGGPTSPMIAAGWTNDVLPVGTRVRIEGAPARREGAKGLLIRKITLDSGRVLTTGKVD
jgi:hypothetical protein